MQDYDYLHNWGPLSAGPALQRHHEGDPAHEQRVSDWGRYLYQLNYKWREKWYRKLSSEQRIVIVVTEQSPPLVGVGKLGAAQSKNWRCLYVQHCGILHLAREMKMKMQGCGAFTNLLISRKWFGACIQIDGKFLISTAALWLPMQNCHSPFLRLCIMDLNIYVRCIPGNIATLNLWL